MVIRKNILTVFIASLAGSAFAQVTLNASSFPAAGETFVSILADTAGVSPGPGGMGTTWNFSSLVNSGQTQTDSFRTVSSTPYASSFPSADICQHTVTPSVNTYIYLDNSGTSVERTGNVDPLTGTSVSYSNTAKQYQFPFSFGSSFNDTYYASYLISSGTVHANGTTTAVADGYGTLTTPLGVYPNVLRITSVRYESDSVFTSSGTVVINATVTYTNWYQPAKFFPVLSIVKTDVTSSISPPSHNKTVSYWMGTPTGIHDMATITGITAYPNPADEKVTLQYHLDNNSVSFISLTDIKGELVFLKSEAQSAGEQQVEIETTSLENGYYFYTVKTAEGIFNGKIIVSR
jgi:hypothetical protein